jgi:hypothetical protein
LTDVFEHYFQTTGVAEYCRQLWKQYGFDFRISRPRRTRLGDFRVFPNGQTQITINADLNPYAFLITYVHEVAHAYVHRHYQQPKGFIIKRRPKKLQPHGKEWQSAFQQLMQPLLTKAVFPETILMPLISYMAHPAATTYAHPALMLVLRQADPHPVQQNVAIKRILLKDVPEGNSFRFSQKTYIRGTLRRTRVVCKEVSSGKSYAILAHAWVENSD